VLKRQTSSEWASPTYNPKEGYDSTYYQWFLGAK
jgi:hypothetical protein